MLAFPELPTDPEHPNTGQMNRVLEAMTGETDTRLGSGRTPFCRHFAQGS
mgnify:CR=1 FL=1